jgi:hypothetical protein
MEIAKTKVSHPGKIGKVGAKKKDPKDKAVAIQLYKEMHKIELLGGMEVVKRMLEEEFEFKWKMKLES